MNEATNERPWPVSVLLCSNDRTLAKLVSRNLSRREYVVRQAPMTSQPVFPVPPGVAFDMVVADVDDEDIAHWDHAAWLRAAFPYLPMVLLTHGGPSATHTEQFQPCRFVRKPFAVDELLAACIAALPVSAS